MFLTFSMSVPSLLRLRSEAGSRPGGRGTFLCFAKEKYPKERRPAVWVPALRSGQLALLESGGGPQDSLRSNNCRPAPASLCAAQPSPHGLGAQELGIAALQPPSAFRRRLF